MSEPRRSIVLILTGLLVLLIVLLGSRDRSEPDNAAGQLTRVYRRLALFAGIGTIVAGVVKLLFPD